MAASWLNLSSASALHHPPPLCARLSALPLQLDCALAATFMAPVLTAVLVMMSFFVLVSALPVCTVE